MNRHQLQSTSPSHLLRGIWRQRQLILQMIRREVAGRYKGAMLGLLWSFLNPLFMLAVYTFVFSVVFKARWSGGGDSKTEFALILFSGLIIFNLFSECITRAPTLILSNANYVKKVVFPLEILPVVALGSALFHALVSLSVWLLVYLVTSGVPPVTILLLPVVILPLLMLIMGASWLLASLGVYLRDMSQVVGILTTMLMFLSPIFYPVSALPIKFRRLLLLNPLAPIIERTRGVMFAGTCPDPANLSVSILVAAFFAWLGYAWFQKTRKGFADVL
jgi:lipopolysaccharide transport system permease protein